MYSRISINGARPINGAKSAPIGAGKNFYGQIAFYKWGSGEMGHAENIPLYKMKIFLSINGARLLEFEIF